MAEIDVGNDSVRSIGPKGARKAWGADRRTRERGTTEGAATATATAKDNEVAPVRGFRSPESEANELGFRDTTVIADDVPPEARPRSHKRKVVSQEKPEPTAPSIPFDPDIGNLLLGLAQGMFTAAWGPEAAFTVNERKMIEPPLGRMMARMAPGDAVKFAAFADPVFLMTGLLIWGMRIWTMQQRAVKPTQATASGPTGPVVQGIPADQIVTHHEPATSGTNGSANVAPHVAAEWGAM